MAIGYASQGGARAGKAGSAVAALLLWASLGLGLWRRPLRRAAVVVGGVSGAALLLVVALYRVSLAPAVAVSLGALAVMAAAVLAHRRAGRSGP